MISMATYSTYLISGPVGNLEVALHYPSSNLSALSSDALCLKSEKLIGIVCHPHPLYGGTMNNKVVTTVVKTLTEMGIPTIRFNFRGVGQSAGHYGEEIGEVDDLKAVVQWGLEKYPDSKLILAGFSFGAHVSARVANRHDVLALINIAPPVNHFDFSHIHRPSCPWLVVHGESDELVPLAEVETFAHSITGLQFEKIPSASHFFHGKLVALREKIGDWLRNVLQYTAKNS